MKLMRGKQAASEIFMEALLPCIAWIDSCMSMVTENNQIIINEKNKILIWVTLGLSTVY